MFKKDYELEKLKEHERELITEEILNVIISYILIKEDNEYGWNDSYLLDLKKKLESYKKDIAEHHSKHENL